MGPEELGAVPCSVADRDQLCETPIGDTEVAGARVEDREHAQSLAHDVPDMGRPAELHRFFGALACEVIVFGNQSDLGKERKTLACTEGKVALSEAGQCFFEQGPGFG